MNNEFEGLNGFESVFELLGDMVSYSADRFTHTDNKKRRAIEELFLMGFEDTEYDDSTSFTVPAGDEFLTVGASEEYGMYMISYRGELFCCDRTEIDLSSTEIN